MALADGGAERRGASCRALYVLYFLNACLTAFPDTAYGSWLNKEMHMPQDVIARYYAFGFMPWFFKPLYCWIAENVSIFGGNRGVYVGICSAASALCYVFTALFCRSIAVAFGLNFLRSVVEAFSELVLGLVLVDAVSRGVESAAEMQSKANGCRIAGSLFAFLVGLPLYGCANSKEVALPDRSIIGMNAVFPILACFGSFFLPRGTSKGSGARAGIRLTYPSRSRYTVLANAYVGLVLVLFILFWTSCKALVTNFAAWVSIEVVSCCLLAAWALRKGLDLLALRNRERVAFDMYLKPLILHSVIPGLFLFGINAVPSAESTWSSLQYFLFDSKANCKVMNASTTAVGLLACLFYSRFLEHMSIRTVLLLAIIASSLAGLLKLPVVLQSTLPSLEVWGINTFTFVLVVSILDAFAKTTLFLALQVLATEACAHVQRSLRLTEDYAAADSEGHFASDLLPDFAAKHWPEWLSPGMMYGFFLSCIDFADTISGWVSAPIISALGISFYPTLHMDGFALLVLLALAGKLIFVALLQVIPT